MTATSTVSNSIRNGILFVLVVLCVHFAARTVVDDRSAAAARKHRQSPMSSEQSPRSEQLSPRSEQLSPMSEQLSPMSEQLSPMSGPPPQHQHIKEHMSDVDAPPPPTADPELYDYVFGTRPPATTSPATVATPSPKKMKKTAPPPPPPSQQSSSTLPTEADAASATEGFMVIGRYEDEDVMCGGKLFDGLEGYNTGSSVFSL